jgi:hypothetical protein
MKIYFVDGDGVCERKMRQFNIPGKTVVNKGVGHLKTVGYTSGSQTEIFY